jgi:hypothetical protein
MVDIADSFIWRLWVIARFEQFVRDGKATNLLLSTKAYNYLVLRTCSFAQSMFEYSFWLQSGDGPMSFMNNQ